MRADLDKLGYSRELLSAVVKAEASALLRFWANNPNINPEKVEIDHIKRGPYVTVLVKETK